MYLFGSKLPANKSLRTALQIIFGFGKNNSKTICDKLGFCFNLVSLSRKQVLNLSKNLNKLNFIFANELKKLQINSFKEKLSIKLLRAFRRAQNLPVRGQRTHTNAKTARKQKVTKKISQ